MTSHLPCATVSIAPSLDSSKLFGIDVNSILCTSCNQLNKYISLSLHDDVSFFTKEMRRCFGECIVEINKKRFITRTDKRKDHKNIFAHLITG